MRSLLREEEKKIREIGEMLRTEEIGGERKESLLERGEESLGKAAERVYLGKNNRENFSV